MKAHKELLRDPLSYVESIGKHDRHHTIDALADEGANTIVRVAFSTPNFNVPLRMLGYFAAAQHITRTYLPKAQLQFVAAANTGARVNRQSAYATKQYAHTLFSTIVQQPGLRATQPDNMLMAYDSYGEPHVPVGRITALLRREPMGQQLEKSASIRNARYPAYVAAHLALHDSVDSIDQAFVPYHRSQAPSDAARIISIGAQSERPFYEARMYCRDAPSFGLAFPGMVEATGQLFTRHVLPPYLPRRQNSDESLFDPLIHSVHRLEDPCLDDVFARYDNVKRDIMFVRDYLAAANTIIDQQNMVSSD